MKIDAYETLKQLPIGTVLDVPIRCQRCGFRQQVQAMIKNKDSEGNVELKYEQDLKECCGSDLIILELPQ
jgi:C4-type Zn-finger protein